MKITTEQAEEICYVQGPRRRNSDRGSPYTFVLPCVSNAYRIGYHFHC